MNNKSLIRKNQLHPDIADLISGYGTDFFTNSEDLLTLSGVIENKIPQNILFTTGNQEVTGIKNFLVRPTFNQTGLATLNDITPEFKFSGNLIVSLNNNKTFGRYGNGQIIPASGKSVSEVFQLAINEPLSPTVNITSNTIIQFNQSSINNSLTISNTINSLNASIKTGYVEWRRNNIGGWTQIGPSNISTLQNTTFSFTHSLIDTNFNSSPFNYRYIVEDTEGGRNTGILNITPQDYVSPSINNINIGPSISVRGSNNNLIELTVLRNSINVNLSSIQLQSFGEFEGGTNTNWQSFGTIALAPNGATIIQLDNNPNLKNAKNISYRAIVTDQFQNTTINLGTKSLPYINYFGYSPNTTLTLAQIQNLTNIVLSDNKNRNILGATAPIDNYTYYCYNAIAGDLTTVIQDGASAILGAFTKLSDVVGINNSGASVTYRVYRSNATQAFTNNNLEFI
jgi:hypothetical protein